MSKIEQQVMASVGIIYVARKLLSRTALEIYVLAASVWAIGRLVWVSRVFDNFFMVEKGGLGATNNYVLYAVEHTHLAVQLTLLIAAAAFIALILDTARSLRFSRAVAA